MRVTCPGCRAVYEIPAQAVDRLPARLRCGACGAEWAPEPSPQAPSSPTPAPPKPHATPTRDDFAAEPDTPPKSGRPDLATAGDAAPTDSDRGSGSGRSAEDLAPRLAATALRTAVQESEAAHLLEQDTVAIPEPPRAEPPRPEPPRAELPRAEPPRTEPTRAEPAPEATEPTAATADAEQPPKSTPHAAEQAVVAAENAPGEVAASDAAESADGSPRRPMRAPSAESARTHQGTLSALEAGNTARTGAAQERRGGARGWITSIVILLVIIGLFLALHGLIAQVWPPSLRLYQAIGLA